MIESFSSEKQQQQKRPNYIGRMNLNTQMGEEERTYQHSFVSTENTLQ